MTTTTNSPGRGAMIDVEGVSKSFGETKTLATTQPPAGRAPGGGAVTGPVQRHLGLTLAAITTTCRDLLDKTTPVLAAIAHEDIARRLPDTDLSKLTKTLRTIAGTSPPKAGQRRGETT
jgi:hypothetical protein